MGHESRRHRRALPALIALAGLSLMGSALPRRAAAADDAPASPDATIVVSAEPVSEAEEKAPTSFVEVIDMSTYEGQLETATSVLAQAVGVQVRRFGGLAGFSTLSIRGSNPNQVRFYLDGIPLTTAGRDVVNLATLPVDSLQRIEVYRGTVPIGFGADGIAGVVNMVTKPPTVEPHSEVDAYYGSFNTAKAVATHSQSIGGYDVLGTVTYLHTDGDFEFTDDKGTEFNPDDDERARRLNNVFDSVDGLIKVRKRIDEQWDVDLTSDTQYLDQGVPSIRSNLALESSYSDLRALNFLRTHGTGLLDGRVDVTASTYGVWEQSAFVDRKREIFSIPFDTTNTTSTVGANLLASWFATETNTLSSFVELESDRFQSSDDLRTPSQIPAQERLDANVALQDEIGLFNGWVVLVPTLRYEHLSDNVSTQFNSLGEPQGARQRQGSDLFSPSIGMEVRPRPWFAFKGNVGRYHRAPNFPELFGVRGFVRGNPQLQPETALNGDLGFVANAADLGWLGEGRMQFAWFHNGVDDLIALTQASMSTFKFQNFSSAIAQGEELTLHGAWMKHLSLDVNYTHQTTTNFQVPYVGNRLPLRPDDEFYSRLELFDALGKLYFECNLVAGNSPTPSNFETLPARATYNLGFLANLRPWLAVGFEVDNLTNNEVRDLLDFPLPGRSYIGSVIARF